MKKEKSSQTKMKFKIPAMAVLTTSVLLSNFTAAILAFAAETGTIVVSGEHTELSHITAIVAKAEQMRNMDDLIHARQDVNEMLESPQKVTFQNRLRSVERLLLNGVPLDDAKFYVSLVEQCLCIDVFKVAQAYVSELKDGPDKEALGVRLEAVQYKVEHKSEDTALASAAATVDQAEKVGNEEIVNYAKYLVQSLPNGDIKTNLLNRLEALQSRLNATLAIAQSAVSKAESTHLKEDFTTADTLVKALPGSSDKQLLLDRLSFLQLQLVDSNIGDSATDSPESITQATQAVSYAESVRTTAAYNAALNLVN